MADVFDRTAQDYMVLIAQKRGKLKGGDNGHLGAESWNLVGLDGKPLASSMFDFEDLGHKQRDMGTTNVGDGRAVLRAAVCIGEFYDSEQVVVNSKHTRPVVVAKGETQLEAVIKSLAADPNSPFGGIWAFSKPLELETARFLNKVFMEGVIAPDYEAGAAELLKDTNKANDPNNRRNHANRFIYKTGQLTRSDVEVLSAQILGADMITQDYDRPFTIRGNSFVASGNKGNRDLESLDSKIVDSMQFGAVVAPHLNSNLVFYLAGDAVAGLGDGCGARFVAAMKGRLMLEMSVYSALKSRDDMDWKRALYDTPFTRDEFESVLDPNLPIVGFSDAFYPKPDGWIETAGVDRVRTEFKNGVYAHTGRRGDQEVLLHKVNLVPSGEYPLVASAIIQPGGSFPGDIYTNEMADKFGVPTVVAIDPKEADAYFKALDNKGKGMPKGHRFFTHQCW